MGLFDLFNSTGALSENQNIPSPYMQVTQDGNTSTQMNPAYTQYVNEQTNPKNMNTGMKLMLLGQALQGQDVSGSIVDYQKGIRDRFRQRAMDQRQLGLDDLNRSETELNIANTQQNMDFAKQKQPLALEQLQLQNQGSNLANQSSQQTLDYNKALNPMLLDNQRLANESSQQTLDYNKALNPMLLDNQRLANQTSQQTFDYNASVNPMLLEQQRLNNANQITTNATAEQRLQQGKTNNARWVGNHEEGVVMRMNPVTGIDEDVTSQYSDAQIAAFKAATKPAATSKNMINPGVNRPLTDSEITRDKVFAKELETFNPTAVSGNIGMLNMIAEGLATQQPGDGSTGLAWMNPIKSAARLIDREGDMGLRSIFDSESIDTQELVAGVIQKNLRETLGAQFTQREGMLLIQRAYNPQLSPQVNAKRLRAAAMLAEAYLKAQQRKVEYYNGNQSSLAGYDPQMDQNIAVMEEQVRQIFLTNGGITGSENSSTPQNGKTSTGASWSVSPSAP